MRNHLILCLYNQLLAKKVVCICLIKKCLDNTGYYTSPGCVLLNKTVMATAHTMFMYIVYAQNRSSLV